MDCLPVIDESVIPVENNGWGRVGSMPMIVADLMHVVKV